MLELGEVIRYVSLLSLNAWYCPAWHLQATDWPESYNLHRLGTCLLVALISDLDRFLNYQNMSDTQPPKVLPLRPLPRLIFASRWLQLPLYLGLIAAQAVYVVHFLVELWHLIEAAFGSQTALQALITSIGYKTATPIVTLNETVIMLVVLALIDVVMISNLLIMVIVGGYETFVRLFAILTQQTKVLLNYVFLKVLILT